MTGQTVGSGGTGRFPLPEKWILDRLPERLHTMFGFRGEPVLSGACRDEIEYVYTISLPDSITMKKTLLLHYVEDDDVTVVFIVDDPIEVDGIEFLVSDWSFRDTRSGGDALGCRMHTVMLRLPEEASHG